MEPSTSRVLPRCAAYGQCGGCTWQHVSYAEQIHQKQEIVQWIFKKFPAEVAAIIPSPREWNYRRRIQLHSRAGKIGFLRRESRDLIQLSTCPITREELLEKWPPRFDPHLGEKFELGLGDDGGIYIEKLDHLPEFSQVNLEQNENLKKTVIEFIKKIGPTKTVYDLYCGSGNFSVAIAEAAEGLPIEEIIGLDTDTRLIEKAQRLKVKKLKFGVARDSDIGSTHNLKDSIVILDPPRRGCSKHLITKLKKDRPKAIIYVSCHPQTAVRDCKDLQPEFELGNIVPLDMFPQTDHIEIVGLLR